MIIAVWGSPGAGKSTFALKMALRYAAMKKNTILVDTNFIVPQINVWFPRATVTFEKSLSTILANNIAIDALASKFTMVNQHLGVLGYGKEMAINALPSRDDTAPTLLAALSSLADVVIVDCQSNITQDILSFVAVDTAAIKIVLMTPDLRGFSWHASNFAMLEEKWSQQNICVTKVLNMVTTSSPAASAERAIGGIGYYLPLCVDLQRELYEGTLGIEKYSGVSKKYKDVLMSIMNRTERFMAARNSTSVAEPAPAPATP